MRVSTIVFVLFAAVVATSSTRNVVPPSLLRSDAPALEIETVVQPTSHGPYELLEGRRVPRTYTCHVSVHDEPGSLKVWGTKAIVLAPGENKTARSALGDLEMTFEARIDQSATRAHTRVEITRSGMVIARQKNTVSLAGR
jgi:hypothetical protein